CQSYSRTAGAKPATGTWQKYVEMWERLHEPERGLFRRSVVDPTRATPSEGPDHDLADRLFIDRVWKCPARGADLEEAWRNATAEMLVWHLAGRPVSPEERLECWSQGSTRRFLVEDGAEWPHRAVTHPWTAQAAQILRWRLLLPIGA